MEKDVKKFLDDDKINMAKFFANSEIMKNETKEIYQATAKAVQESIYDACNQAKTIKFEDGYKGVIPSCKDY